MAQVYEASSLTLESPYMKRVLMPNTVGHENDSPNKRGSAEGFLFFEDSGGRRSGFRKREFSYDAHIPERRSGAERRSGTDRRERVAYQTHSKGRRGVEGKIDS
jgi:hypothetical protein